MLGVGGVHDDGGSPPVDSASVKALQTVQGSPGDVARSLHHSPQAFAAHDGGTGVPPGV